MSYTKLQHKRWPSHCMATGVLCAPVLRLYAAMECVYKVCTALGTFSIPHRIWPQGLQPFYFPTPEWIWGGTTKPFI